MPVRGSAGTAPSATTCRNEVTVSSRRTLILVGAIVVGAIAALLILRYVGSVQDKASSDNHLVPVVVATGDIAKGTAANDALAQGLIEIRNRRQADLPGG